MNDVNLGQTVSNVKLEQIISNVKLGQTVWYLIVCCKSGRIIHKTYYADYNWYCLLTQTVYFNFLKTERRVSQKGAHEKQMFPAPNSLTKEWAIKLTVLWIWAPEKQYINEQHTAPGRMLRNKKKKHGTNGI